MNEEMRNPDGRIEDGARRKLVRGAFAVPALLTLHSGSAFAASSANSCLMKRNMSVITEPLNTTSDDMFFRYRLWVIRKKNGDMAIESAWIRGADLTDYIRLGQTPFVTTGNWQMFSVGSNALSGTPTMPEPVPTGSQTFNQTGPWVSLRVNGTGALVGAGASPAGSGSAVGDSCWNSFALQAPRM